MDWLATVYIVALAAVIAVVPFSLVRQWLRGRSSQVDDAFAGITVPAGRELQSEVAQVTWLAHEVEAQHTVTRASIRHAARLPYVVQFEGNRVSCYDKKGYEDWTANGGDPRCVPLPVQQLCDIDLLKRLQSVPGLAELEGIVAITPGRIVALEEGNRLDSLYAKKLMDVMLKLAEEAERPAFTLPAAKTSPALP
jgi:hypothetical protein